VHINPHKAREVVFGEGDKLIVLSEF